MSKLTFKIAIFLSIISCQYDKNDKVDFVIINKSSFDIDSLIITNWYSESFVQNIRTADSLILSLDFKDIDSKGDGSYSVSYYVDEKKNIKSFGYYSNGIPTHSNYNLEVYNDTLIITEQILRKKNGK